MRLSEAIALHKADILADWMAEARTLAAARDLSEPVILDGMPYLLDRMIEWVERDRPVDAIAYEEEAEHHAVHRLRHGYALPQIVAEYHAFRAIIARRVSPELEGDVVPQLERVHLAIDAAITDAVVRFTDERQRSDQESQARLQAVIDNAPVIIFVKEYRRTGGAYLMVNRHFTDRFGKRVEDVLGRTADEVHDLADPAHVADSLANDREVMRTGEPLRAEETFPERDGLHTWLVLKFPLRDTGGTPYAVCAIATDITEERQRAESRERIIGVLAHDLRSPLSTISMAAERLERSVTLDASARKTVERLARGARTMESMIRDLADFSRGRFAGGIPITPARVAIAAIVRGVADDLQTAHPGRTIHRTLSGDLTGSWDGERLRQAITNLVTNALTHGTGDVTVEADGTDDALRLRVHNPGEPIPAEAQARLFQPFQKSRGSKGLGLGLYIVREIVLAHGGTVDVTSDQSGTAFTITIPRR